MNQQTCPLTNLPAHNLLPNPPNKGTHGSVAEEDAVRVELHDLVCGVVCRNNRDAAAIAGQTAQYVVLDAKVVRNHLDKQQQQQWTAVQVAALLVSAAGFPGTSSALLELKTLWALLQLQEDVLQCLVVPLSVVIEDGFLCH